jgi:hypothetical protein
MCIFANDYKVDRFGLLATTEKNAKIQARIWGLFAFMPQFLFPSIY